LLGFTSLALLQLRIISTAEGSRPGSYRAGHQRNGAVRDRKGDDVDDEAVIPKEINATDMAQAMQPQLEKTLLAELLELSRELGGGANYVNGVKGEAAEVESEGGSWEGGEGVLKG